MKLMETKYLNSITLLPNNDDHVQHINTTFKTKAKLFIILCAFFCLITFLNDIIWMITRINRNLEYWQPLVFVIGDIIRGLYYLGTFFCNRLSLKLQLWAIVLSFLIHSIMVTELCIYTDEKEGIMGRIMSITPLFLLVSQCLMVNFIQLVIPFILSLLYPVFRLLGISLFSSLDSEYYSEIMIINMVLSNLVCTYFTRRYILSYICEDYHNERINEQWKETINSINNGILILSKAEPRNVYFLNSALKSLIQQRYENIKEDNEYEDCLHKFVIKVVKADTNEEIVKVPLMDLNETTKNEKFYLDGSNDFIEITLKKILYKKEDAMLITFIDCNAINKVQELAKNNRYKDSAMAVLTHEIRNPLNVIVQSLDYLTKFVSEESTNTLEISKECCNSIMAQIDDLSVICIERV